MPCVKGVIFLRPGVTYNTDCKSLVLIFRPLLSFHHSSVTRWGQKK